MGEAKARAVHGGRAQNRGALDKRPGKQRTRWRRDSQADGLWRGVGAPRPEGNGNSHEEVRRAGTAQKTLRLNFLFPHETGEMIEGAIVTPFSIPWKTTARQLTAPYVILQALTADAFSGARIVAAVAFLKILFLVALHSRAPRRTIHRYSPF